MRRRQFIGLVGAAGLGVPLRTWVHAQEAKIPIVAFLGLAPASGYTGRLDGIRTGLREFGFVEGKNFAFEFRWGETREQLRELAIQLIRLDPAVVMASGNSAALAVKREVAATAVPMVFALRSQSGTFQTSGGVGSKIAIGSNSRNCSNRFAVFRRALYIAAVVRH